VPATIHDRDGAAFRMLDGKAVALIEFLPGVSPTKPTPAQISAVGSALAQMHLASQDFALSRPNSMSFVGNLALLEKCGEERLGSVHSQLAAMLNPAREAAKLDLSHLPAAQIHADLFPDNVLMLGDQVSGMIDFYFACTGAMALDLAITHAAWCFDTAGECGFEQSQALLSGYEAVRPLESAERALLPDIAKGAALRFVASRAEDWFDTPSDAHVARKDPMEFAERWQFYDKFGKDIF
jgi:homoserine kinase type II